MLPLALARADNRDRERPYTSTGSARPVIGLEYFSSPLGQHSLGRARNIDTRDNLLQWFGGSISEWNSISYHPKALNFSGEDVGSEAVSEAALELSYDWHLHQILGYTCCLDEANRKVVKELQCLNSLAKKPGRVVNLQRMEVVRRVFWIFGLRCLLQCIWSCPFSRYSGGVVNVMDEDDLDTLLGVTVIMWVLTKNRLVLALD